MDGYSQNAFALRSATPNAIWLAMMRAPVTNPEGLCEQWKQKSLDNLPRFAAAADDQSSLIATTSTFPDSQDFQSQPLPARI